MKNKIKTVQDNICENNDEVQIITEKDDPWIEMLLLAYNQPKQDEKNQCDRSLKYIRSVYHCNVSWDCDNLCSVSTPRYLISAI